MPARKPRRAEPEAPASKRARPRRDRRSSRLAGAAFGAALVGLLVVAAMTPDDAPSGQAAGPDRGGSPRSAGQDGRPKSRPAGPDVIAALDGLAPGDALGSWKVRAIGLEDDEAMRRSITIEVEHADARELVLWVARKGTHSFLPVRTTDRYAFYYGRFEPQGTQVTEEEISGLLAALAARVEKAEGSAPVPAEL